VLIPRPETEGLVDVLLEADLPPGSCVVDLGTGTGCIAITLACKRPDFELFALDISDDALAVAGDNARTHGVGDRIDFRPGDMFSPPRDWSGRMHAVVSNPPYVGVSEWQELEPEVRDFDPRVALVGGESGVEGYAPLILAARELIRPEGLLVLEVGFGQAESVMATAASCGFGAIRVERDLRGIPRVVVAEGPQS